LHVYKAEVVKQHDLSHLFNYCRLMPHTFRLYCKIQISILYLITTHNVHHH